MKNQKSVTRTKDKDLLILLGFIVALFLIYYFFLSPSLDKASQLKLDQKLVYEELQTAQATVEQLTANRQKASVDLAALTEKYRQFFYEINQERILFNLDTLIDNTNLAVKSYTQTKPVAKAIDSPFAVYAPLQYLLLDQAAVVNEELAEGINAEKAVGGESKEVKAAESEYVAVSYISLGFSETTYQDFFNFLRAIETFDRGIIIENFSIKNGETRTDLSGQVVLGIYSLAKPDKNESGDLEFTPVLPKGKPNPFQ